MFNTGGRNELMLIDKKNKHCIVGKNLLTEVKEGMVTLYYVGAESPQPSSVKHINGILGYKYDTAVFLTDEPTTIIENMHIDLEKVPKFLWEVKLPLSYFRSLGGIKKNIRKERQIPVPNEAWQSVIIEKKDRVFKKPKDLKKKKKTDQFMAAFDGICRMSVKKIGKMFTKMSLPDRKQFINSLLYQESKLEKKDARKAGYIRYIVARLNKLDSKDRFDSAQKREDKETEERKETLERFRPKDK